MNKRKMVDNLNKVVTEMIRRQAYCQQACQKIGELTELTDMCCNLCARSSEFYLRRQPLAVQVHYNALIRAMKHQSQPTALGVAI